jgi:DNA-binding response OmpR family regulator
MSAAASILVYGHEARLLETRRWVLEKAGFGVQVTMELQELERLTVNQGPDLLILCHTLSVNDCGEVLQRARELRPEMKVLLLTKHFPVSPEGAEVEVLSAFIGPKVLLATVEKVLCGAKAQR